MSSGLFYRAVTALEPSHRLCGGNTGRPLPGPHGRTRAHAGFDFLYEQKFAEAREAFASWESRNPEDPFGVVAVAASYLFEELYLQGVLTSDFFLNEIPARD